MIYPLAVTFPECSGCFVMCPACIAAMAGGGKIFEAVVSPIVVEMVDF
jgi:hypothetical protein